MLNDTSSESNQNKTKIDDSLTNDTSNASITDDDLIDMPLTEHLIELRSRLIKIFVVVIVVFIALAGFSRELYDLISNPLVSHLPANATMIATDVTSPFMTPLRLSLFVAIFISMPYILYQIWAFVAPGLYKHEKKIALPVLLSSILLFYVGVAFAYFVVLQGALKFFIMFTPDNVIPMTDMESYLGFVMKLFLVFGATFEIPVLVFMLVLIGAISVQSLTEKRRYVIVACFAAAGVLSPPDVPTMFLLALPMILLFELGLLMAKLVVKPDKVIESLD